MEFVTTDDGTRLYIRSQGSGPVLVVPYGTSLGFDALADSHTVVVYDPRNRGFSDAVPGTIDIDVDDLEAVRKHLGLDTIAILGHSYLGLLTALYAIRYPHRVSRAILIGPAQPHAGTQYPPPLSYADHVMADVLAKLKTFDRNAPDPVTRFWDLMRPVYVADPSHASRIHWERPDAPREATFMAYWMGTLLPSIQRLQLADADIAGATAPILVVHGLQDRNAPYGGGREWAMRLPDARLLSVDRAGHAPWLEHPDLVMPALRMFLAGDWPPDAEKVTSLM